MKQLGLSIKVVIEVDDDQAEKFLKSPPGFLTIFGEPLGDENLKVGLINEPDVEPLGMNTKVVSLAASDKDKFLES